MTLLSSPIGGFSEASSRGALAGWVTSGTQTRPLGLLRDPRYVLRVHVHVLEAFNGSGTDTLTVGYDSDTDAYATSVDVSSTGVKAVTLGTGVGFDGTNREAKAYYANGGGEPSTGKALIVVEFLRVPKQP